MFDHVSMKVVDLGKSITFYEASLKALGHMLTGSDEQGAGFGPDKNTTNFWLIKTDKATSSSHVAFRAKSRRDVDRFYEAAIKNGGRDNGGPGLRESYSPTYYAAFVVDPDGNNIEAVCMSAS